MASKALAASRQNFRGRGFKDFQVFDFARGANGGGNGFRINRNEAGAIELTGYGVQSFSEFGGYGMRKDVRPVELGAFQSCEIQFTVKNIFGTGRHRRLAEQGIVKHLPAFAIWGGDHAAFKNRRQIGTAIQQGGIAAGFRVNRARRPHGPRA